VDLGPGELQRRIEPRHAVNGGRARIAEGRRSVQAGMGRHRRPGVLRPALVDVGRDYRRQRSPAHDDGGAVDVAGASRAPLDAVVDLRAAMPATSRPRAEPASR
jgi:hypothetical protein